MDEQKQSYEKDLDELRTKLRKQRTTDTLSTNQEVIFKTTLFIKIVFFVSEQITRIEQELKQEWQEKLDRQQAQNERLLASKGKEFEQLKTLFDEIENKVYQTQFFFFQ